MAREVPIDERLDSRVRLLRQRAGAGALWIDGSGASMEPSVRAGDRLLVEARERPPKIGEVWLHADVAGRLIAHRFLGRRGQELVFRGDAERQSDPRILRAQLVGRVIYIERGGCRRPIRRSAVLKTYLRLLQQRIKKFSAA